MRAEDERAVIRPRQAATVAPSSLVALPVLGCLPGFFASALQVDAV